MVRIGFIGCHEISWFCLKKIAELSFIDHNDLLVFNLESEKGSKYSAYVGFESLQKEFNFELHNVSDVADEKNIKILENANLDILFIIGWHKIVPQSLLDVAKIRLGLHSSLLPKDRGSSPINWQIIRGNNTGGMTLFHLAAGVDSGSIVDQVSYSIEFADDVRDVYFKATSTALLLLERNWKQIQELIPKSILQNEEEVTLNPLRKPSDGLINWNNSSVDCYNWIRALTHPYPGAFTYHKDKKIIILKSKLSELEATQPGEIIECDEKLIVSTRNKCLEIQLLKVENEPPCDGKLFSLSYHLKKNDFFQNNL